MGAGLRIGALDLQGLIEEAAALDEFEAALAAVARGAPADVSAILQFFEVSTGEAFDVPPTEAVSYFKGKGLQPTFSYADMLGSAHDQAFTVAKMMDVDMLGQVRASLDSALANGTPFKEWADNLVPLLQSGGWWGRKAVVDPLTGQEIIAQLGAPWRLETIFRTNMQASYAAGQWQEIEAQADVAPFLMYDAVDDLRTRALHKAWDNTVLPVSSAWWKTHYPPNGYNCRCGVIQLDPEQLEALGLEPAKKAPDDGTYEWKNPRTGSVEDVPNGLDPGFDKNVGTNYGAQLKQLLDEKAKNLPRSMQDATAKALAQARKMAAEQMSAAQAAQKEIAAATGKAMLERAQKLASEKAKEWAAQQQLDAIKAGKETAGKGAAYKIKALAQASKSGDWPELKPTEQLAQVEALAAEFKAKAELSSKLALYKKAVLAGKLPAPAQVKAFTSLTPDEQASFLAKIEAEKAAIEAQKQAAAAKAAQEAAAAAQAEQVPTSRAESLLADGGPDPANLVMVGRKTKGGTEGAIYQDTTTGQRYVVKFNGSDDAVRNEVLAGKLYQLAGVEAPDLYAINVGGRPALASRIVDGIKEVGAKELASTDSVMDGFAVDAWLANWDAIGLNYDNTVLIGGRALRIDVGGSLRYRALGGLKGTAFGDTVGELDSLRDASLNRQSAAVFGRITKSQIEAGVVRVLRTRDDDIRALVQKFGPVDAAERQALVDRLIARKADLARRYPDAAAKARELEQAVDQAPTAPPRVTDTEQRFVEDSRVNGYAFPTDGDQIEDHMVLVHTFKRADNSDATRGFFKLRPDAGRALRDRIAQDVADDAGGVSLTEARDTVLAAVKSINYRADKGEPFDLKTETRVKEAIKAIDQLVLSLRRAKGTPKDQAQLENIRAIFTDWRDALEQSLPLIQQRGKAIKVTKMFPAAGIPDRLDFDAPTSAGGKPAVWRKVEGEYRFETADFDRSFAKLNGGDARVAGTGLRYEANLPDGTRVVYFPHDPKVPWAMQGITKIDVPGKSAQATGRVFDAINEIGIEATRADELARRHLYVNAFARIRLVNDPRMTKARTEFEAIQGNDEAALQAKLKALKKATGVDIEASQGWKNVDGTRQAFGHGRAHQLRPDLDTPEFEQLEKTHILYHNPQGLGTDAGSGVFDRVKAVIEGGGMFASLTDRVRRGVPLAGSSVSSDLSSGGGDYLFTRIIHKTYAKGTGIYWRTRQLRRMDAITYDSDQFGRTTPGHIESNRLGQTVDSFKSAAKSSSNETIFKGGLSVFDDVDRIVLSSQAEVKAAIDWMKSKGYKQWPDGRPLDQVIITRSANSAKP